MVISSTAADRARPRAAGGDGRPPALPVGQGLVRRRRLPQDRPARPGDALRGRGLRRADRGELRRADRPLADPARRRRRLRGDPARRHDRRLPDREPRADAEPAADEAGESRRPDRAGGARAAGADPGQGGAPVHRRPRAASRRSHLRAAGRPRAAARAAPRHARRRRLPGPGARGGDGARGLHDRRGGRAAAGDEPEAERGGDRGLPPALHRRRRTERGQCGGGGPRLRQAGGVLRLRLPEVARRRVRPARLPVRLAAPPLSGRVPLLAPERPADGLLPAVEPRAGRAAARGGGAAAGREPERRRLHPRRRVRCGWGSPT